MWAEFQRVQIGSLFLNVRCLRFEITSSILEIDLFYPESVRSPAKCVYVHQSLIASTISTLWPSPCLLLCSVITTIQPQEGKCVLCKHFSLLLWIQEIRFINIHTGIHPCWNQRVYISEDAEYARTVCSDPNFTVHIVNVWAMTFGRYVFSLPAFSHFCIHSMWNLNGARSKKVHPA